MEKEPRIKIIGGAPQEVKKNIQKEYYNLLFGDELLSSLSEKAREEIKKLEYPKSEEEQKLIEFANKKTNVLMEEAGVFPFDAPLTAFHILPEDLHKKVTRKETAACYAQIDRAILLNARYARQSLIFFAELSFHELLHLKEIFVLEAQKIPDEENFWVTEFRGGLKINSSQKVKTAGKKHTHFKGLNEAIVASQEKKYIKEALNREIG